MHQVKSNEYGSVKARSILYSSFLTGCGVNVSNKYPTMSINDCIQLHNNSIQKTTNASTNSTSHNSTNGGSGTSDGSGCVILPPFTVEALLALTLNRLERYLGLYEHSGMTVVEKDYYYYWLHR